MPWRYLNAGPSRRVTMPSGENTPRRPNWRGGFGSTGLFWPISAQKTGAGPARLMMNARRRSRLVAKCGAGQGSDETAV